MLWQWASRRCDVTCCHLSQKHRASGYGNNRKGEGGPPHSSQTAAPRPRPPTLLTRAPTYKSPTSPSHKRTLLTRNFNAASVVTQEMPLFLNTSAPERLSSVGAIVLDKLRRMGESVAAIAGVVSPSSSQPNDDLAAVSRAYHDECSLPASDPHPTLPEHATEQTGEQTPTLEAPTHSSDELEQRKRHAAHMLSEYGIKVRDFAYESSLPPVPPLRRTGFGGRQPLKRTREEFVGEKETHAESEDRQSKKQRLQRELTEPIPSSQSIPPSQRSGFGNLEDLHDVSFHMGHSEDESEATRMVSMPQRPTDWPVSFGSQESSTSRPEWWIDTPPLTPRGSYISMPQVESIPSAGSLMDLDVAQVEELSERPTSIETEQTQPVIPRSSLAQSDMLLSLLSNLTSLPPTPLSSSHPLPHSHHRCGSLRDISMAYNAIPHRSPSPPSPRYLLRNRPAKGGSSTSPRTGSRRLSNARASGLPSRPKPRKPRSSVAKRASGSAQTAPSKPVRRSPRFKGSLAAKR